MCFILTFNVLYIITQTSTGTHIFRCYIAIYKFLCHSDH